MTSPGTPHQNDFKEVRNQETSDRREDADLEKGGRILNRVIRWGRDGITTEADHRHAMEMLMDLDLERANHTATPCSVERKKGIAQETD